MKISKKVKRLVSVALSAAMVFSMGMTSFAANHGSGGFRGDDGKPRGTEVTQQTVYLYLKNPDNGTVSGDLNSQGYFTIGKIQVPGLEDPSASNFGQTAVITDEIESAANNCTERYEKNSGIKLSDIDWKNQASKLHVQINATDYPEANGQHTWHLDAVLKSPEQVSKIYTVQYQWSGAAPDGVTLPASSPVSEGNSYQIQQYGGTAPAGWTFDGWYDSTEETANTYAPEASMTVASDVTLYGKWSYTKPEEENVTVTYTWSDSTNVPEGVSLPDGDPEAEGIQPFTIVKSSDHPIQNYIKAENVDLTGWTFDGWYTKITGENDEDVYQKVSASSIPVDKDIILYGKWTKENVTDPDPDIPTPEDPGPRSKSKIATNLDKNFESQITLSLPSAQEELVSDIVFVVDKSTSSISASTSAGVRMLNQLAEDLEDTGASIKVGVIAFDGTSHIKYDLKEYSKDKANDIVAAMNASIDADEKMSGTNIEAGLIAAKSMLEADGSVVDSRKYVILVSDGLTRLYTGNDEKTKIVFHEYYNGGTEQETTGILAGEYTGWCAAYGYADGEYSIPGNTWAAYYDMISGKIAKQSYRYEVDFRDVGQKSWFEVDQTNRPTNYIEYKDVPNSALAVDYAFYEAYNMYIDLTESYNCYAVCTGGSDLGQAFMSALNGDKTVDFTSIHKDIYYLLDAGSRVEDYMGYVEGDYNFDFVNEASKLSMTVGNAPYDADQISDNVYGFKPLDNGGYAYTLTYNKGNGTTDEHFVWTINEAVSNFAPVSLTYTVKLTNPKTEAGTYGKFDPDGSQRFAGLYTNNSATLYPVDSNEHHGDPEAFNKPTVSYTVSNAETPVVDINDGRKVLYGANLSDYTFRFRVERYENETATGEVQTVSNTASGAINFIPYQYSEDDLGELAAKTFTYIVTEIDDGQANINYDDTRYQVDVKLSKGNGNLIAQVSSIKNLNTGADVDSIVFTNSYSERYYPIDPYEPPTSRPSSTPSSEPVEIEDSDVPLVSVPEESSSYVEIDESSVPLTDIPDDEVPLIDKTPQTSDESNLTIWLIVLAVSALGLVVALVFEKKNRYQPRHYR